MKNGYFYSFLHVWIDLTEPGPNMLLVGQNFLIQRAYEPNKKRGRQANTGVYADNVS